MSKRKRRKPPAGHVTAEEIVDALYPMVYRLEELLLMCDPLEVRYTDEGAYEIRGRLRYVPGQARPAQLSAERKSLAEALEEACRVAGALERPHLPVVASLEEAARLGGWCGESNG